MSKIGLSVFFVLCFYSLAFTQEEAPNNELMVQTMNASGHITRYELVPMGAMHCWDSAPCNFALYSNSESQSLSLSGNVICGHVGFEVRPCDQDNHQVVRDCATSTSGMRALRYGFYKINVYVDEELLRSFYYDTRDCGLVLDQCSDCYGNDITIRYNVGLNIVWFFNDYNINPDPPLLQTGWSMLSDGQILTYRDIMSCSPSCFQPFWDNGLVIIPRDIGGVSVPHLVWGPYSAFQPTGYRIYWALSPAGPPGSFSLLAELGPNITDWTHRDLLIGSGWRAYYKVQAFSGATTSSFTNTVDIGTSGFFKPSSDKKKESAQAPHQPASLVMRDRLLFAINNIILPIRSDGVIADATVDSVTSGMFDGHSFLFSGGFMLSGKRGDSIWSNAVTTSGRAVDYVSGRVHSLPRDSNGVYFVQRADAPFGPSWQEWRGAVALGADFYDSDGDGMYTPIDRNGNGRWDITEDSPDMLGDATAWCVYTDRMPDTLRRWRGQRPLGIEIHQTLFGYRGSAPMGNILFVRYRIINRGTVASFFDSVYFGSWADSDLGDYNDDLTGCDTTRGAGYTWNDGSDFVYGATCPAFFISHVQGPAAYVPGVSFIDVNGNRRYDPGEPALDTALVRRGPLLGTSRFPGAMNLKMSSFTNSNRTLVRGDPNTKEEARNYLLGKQPNGDILNPCTDPVGSVFRVPCTSVSDRFWYSGDPVNSPGYGWIDIVPRDKRQMQNTGPFELRANDPIEIIVAYAIGRGIDERNSVRVGRAVVDTAHAIFRRGFPVVVTSVAQTPTAPTSFRVHQNYPNPFNPSTKIKFELPRREYVSLQVFDILGKELVTLVNKELESGEHDVQLDLNQFAGGVYFYRLHAGDFVQTKKLVLLR